MWWVYSSGGEGDRVNFGKQEISNYIDQDLILILTLVERRKQTTQWDWGTKNSYKLSTVNNNLIDGNYSVTYHFYRFPFVSILCLQTIA